MSLPGELADCCLERQLLTTFGATSMLWRVNSAASASVATVSGCICLAWIHFCRANLAQARGYSAGKLGEFCAPGQPTFASEQGLNIKEPETFHWRKIVKHAAHV